MSGGGGEVKSGAYRPAMQRYVASIIPWDGTLTEVYDAIYNFEAQSPLQVLFCFLQLARKQGTDLVYVVHQEIQPKLFPILLYIRHPTCLAYFLPTYNTASN